MSSEEHILTLNFACGGWQCVENHALVHSNFVRLFLFGNAEDP